MLPVEYQYRLILLDQEQYGLSLGWEKRFITAMDKLLNLLDESKASNEWLPKPTPLCHWCSFCWTNPDAKDFKNECPYYSLWTPENKTFEINQKYNSNDKSVNSGTNYQSKSTGQTNRKVIF